MKNAIILHGRPDEDEYYSDKFLSASNQHWFPWLAQQLMIRDIFAVTPEVQYCFRPRYDEWVREIERYDINEETLVVGHSCGGGFWVRYLSEHPELKVAKAILVAPWINPDDNPASDTADFFKFTIDKAIAERCLGGMTVIVSDDDEASVLKSVDMIKSAAPEIKLNNFIGKGHFTLESLGTTEFSEILDEIYIS
ncbi:hypothetical protein RAAC3_TM7C00001G0877 [Candidatus Saccharibacteria bacterium RAAC3_TM7_1]|nr:hypothetical protein RAAC3_TM7C00001G0877 [Candidatus Saccharibacteria bacterium RAAC3_TM7_1]HCZ28868.1 hypothetical protein [Candidatus Saccharibacteria bacterium]